MKKSGRFLLSLVLMVVLVLGSKHKVDAVESKRVISYGRVYTISNQSDIRPQTESV